MAADDRAAEVCDRCSVKLIDTTVHYVGITDRQRYCPDCWRVLSREYG